MVVAEAAAAFPAGGFGDAAGVLAVDDLLHPRDDRMAVVAKLDHDPATAHLVSDGSRRPGTGERVETKSPSTVAISRMRARSLSGFGVANRSLGARSGKSFFSSYFACRLWPVSSSSDQPLTEEPVHVCEIGPTPNAFAVRSEPNFSRRELRLNGLRTSASHFGRFNDMSVGCDEVEGQVRTRLRRVERVPVEPRPTRVVVGISKVASLRSLESLLGRHSSRLE